jgi:hypothetical protein
MGSTIVVESWSFFERFCFALFLGFAKVVVVVALGTNWRFIYRGFACGLEGMESQKMEISLWRCHFSVYFSRNLDTVAFHGAQEASRAN